LCERIRKETVWSKSDWRWVWWYMPVISALQRLRQYDASWRPAWVMEQDLVSKNNKNKKLVKKTN
jgi:hypothetical protein